MGGNSGPVTPGAYDSGGAEEPPSLDQKAMFQKEWHTRREFHRGRACYSS
jgi:hypothetical protein